MILCTIIFLFVTAIFVILSGLTEINNAELVVAFILVPLSVYSFYKKKKSWGFYFIVLFIIQMPLVDVYIKENIRIYGINGDKMSLQERLNTIITETELSDQERKLRHYNNEKQYFISKLSSYEVVEKKGNKIYYYNDNEENIKTKELIDEILSENSHKVEKIFNCSTPSEINIAIRYDKNLDSVAEVNGANIFIITPFDETLYDKEFFKNVILHEYAHVITMEKLTQFGGVGFGNMPTWFAEGLGTWVAVNIGTDQIDEERLYEVDLTYDEYGTTELQISNYYGCCYKVVDEIIKEVGLEGIEKCIELWANENLEDALKVVTGKALEDYYYIFD